MGVPDWESVKQTYFNDNGSVINSEEESVAKIIHYSNVDKYYVRDSRNGLLDVNSIKDDYSVKIRGTDKDLYPFSQITEQSFELYLEFLKSRSGGFLRSAEKTRRIDV